MHLLGLLDKVETLVKVLAYCAKQVSMSSSLCSSLVMTYIQRYEEPL